MMNVQQINDKWLANNRLQKNEKWLANKWLANK